MENMMDAAVVEVLFPMAMLGGLFVVTATVFEGVEWLKAKKAGRKYTPVLFR